jgi:hypothetical protein
VKQAKKVCAGVVKFETLSLHMQKLKEKHYANWTHKHCLSYPIIAPANQHAGIKYPQAFYTLIEQ